MSSSIQLSSSASEEPKDVTCRLCRRQFAKYTCPTCNVPYCSLTCFRSQAHNQCSEGFYKKEIESNIHGEPSRSAQERQRMMELLRKFEAESMDQLSLSDDDDGVEPSDLANRFEAVDLDSVSSDALWSMLTPEERSKFMKVFNDPTSELAQQLLSSEQLETDIKEPWWKASVAEEYEDDASPQSRDQALRRRSGARPNMMKIPVSMVKPIPSGHPLVYNMCAICISYAYITRHLGISTLQSLMPGDPEYYEARRLVAELVPFLTDRKSMKLYSNLSTVITDIWSTFGLGKMTSDLFSLLLRDAAHLLEPMRITQVESSAEAQDIVPGSHPHIGPILVLSDLNELFLARPDSHGCRFQMKSNHITHKLVFYAAHIASTPTIILRGLVEEVSTRADIYLAEATIVEARHAGNEQQRKLTEEMSRVPAQ